MKRRAFLRLAMGGAIAGALGVDPLGTPGRLRRAFGDVSVDAEAAAAEEIEALLEGLRRARAAGKPLLALVVPTDPATRWDRGGAWGELLNHGDVEQLWPLALFEVTCSSVAAVRKVAGGAAVPAAPGGAGAQAPMALVLDPHGQTNEPALPVVVELPPYADPRVRIVRLGGPGPEPEEVTSSRRITGLAGALRRTVEELRVQRLAERTSAHLGADEVTTLRRLLRRPTSRATAADRRLLDHGASLVAETALSAGPRAPLLARLVEEVVKPRLRDQPPPGSHWGTSAGCGVRWEPSPDDLRREERQRRADEEARRRGELVLERIQSSVGCGMGHVPEASRRFLGFFVQWES